MDASNAALPRHMEQVLFPKKEIKMYGEEIAWSDREFIDYVPPAHHITQWTTLSKPHAEAAFITNNSAICVKHFKFLQRWSLKCNWDLFSYSKGVYSDFKQTSYSHVFEKFQLSMEKLKLHFKSQISKNYYSLYFFMQPKSLMSN